MAQRNFRQVLLGKGSTARWCKFSEGSFRVAAGAEFVNRRDAQQEPVKVPCKL